MSAQTIQKAFRLPVDVVKGLERRGGNATEYVTQAIREKLEKDEIEAFRESARRISLLPAEFQDVDYAFEAQSEVALGNP